MNLRRPFRLALGVMMAAAAIGVPLLEISAVPTGGAVVATVTATPSTNVVDGTSLSVSGTVPAGVASVVLIECDSTQSGDVGTTYNPADCDTNAADEVTLPVTNNAFSGSFVFHDPLTTSGAGTVSCAAGCTLLADNPSPGDVAALMMLTGHSCNGVFDGAPQGSLVKTTSAGPTGSTVSPGQTITVTLNWTASDFVSGAPDKTDDCVEIGTTLSTAMSQEHKPGPAGGTDTFSYVVPSGGTNGQQICDRGSIAGTGPTGPDAEKSAILCYTVMGVSTPEVSQALLLPVAGLLVGGGGLLLARRRRNRARVA
jgi:LPXTG-motif cell wall-anchored protein